MEKDFTFKDGVYLVKGEHELDLHNEFDFTEVRYSIADRRSFLKGNLFGAIERN